jgi:hypothetical protein
VGVAAFKPDYPCPQACNVVVNQYHIQSWVSLREVCGRHDVPGILGEKGQPIVETPIIQQRSLFIEEVFYFLPQADGWESISHGIVAGVLSHN